MTTPEIGAKTCSICGRTLNVETDPLSLDCGGDCLGCIKETDEQVQALDRQREPAP